MIKQSVFHKTLQLMVILAVVTQTAACAKKDETKAASRLALAEAKKSGNGGIVVTPEGKADVPAVVEPKDDAPAEKPTEEKKTETSSTPTPAATSSAPAAAPAMPAPDQIPGYNTAGSAFTGTLQVRSDEDKKVKNAQCNIELIDEEGKALAVLNVGGYEVRMVVDKTWIQKDQQSFSLTGMKAQAAKGAYVVVPDKLVQMTYSVNAEEVGKVKIMREAFFVADGALGSQSLAEFINAEKKSLFENAKYEKMSMLKDGLSVLVNEKNQPLAFSYFQQELIAGSATEKASAGGDKQLSASYKKSLIADCVTLKSEKK